MNLATCQRCKKPFHPSPRTARFQKTCSRAACQKERKRAKGRRWRSLHPDYDASRLGKKRAWARAYPDYWQQYRRNNPEYARRDNRRRCQSARRARRSANQTLIRDLARRKLEGLTVLGRAISSANQTPIHRLSRGLLDYLVWRDASANQTAIGGTAPGSG